MQNNSLSNIRFDSIKSIFNCISLSKNISRAEISEKTHLSVVTVGKIVDALSDLDVVTQSKSPRASAGRRASVVNVNKSSFIIIFDLTSYKFHSTVLDLSLNLIETFDGKYETLSSYPDNLTSFINQTKSYVNKKY
jgi:DNA-binding MarR family transcriptional regulator